MCRNRSTLACVAASAVCRMPRYPFAPPWYEKLAASVQDKPLGPRRICPHKGADLSRMPVRDGCVTCPLHGLRFDAETGRVKCQ